MKSIMHLTVLLLLIVITLSAPAPQSITWNFGFMVILLGLIIGMSIQSVRGNLLVYNSVDKKIAVLLIFYLFIMLTSCAIGVFTLERFFQPFRSTMPYIALLPLAYIGLVDRTASLSRYIAMSLIAAGVIQSMLIILLFSVAYQLEYSPFPINSVMSILINRITLWDARVTLSCLLASAILPFYWIVNGSSKKTKLLCMAIIILSCIAALVTLSRSFLLAIFVGWMLFFGSYFLLQEQRFWPTVMMHVKSTGLILLSILLLILSIEPLFLCVKALALRTAPYAMSSAPTLIPPTSVIQVHNEPSKVPSAVDMKTVAEETIVNVPLNSDNIAASVMQKNREQHGYSNGRVTGEWLPAFKAWQNSNLFQQLFGVGAGVPFFVEDNQAKTYVHNQLLYALLYTGVVGLCIVLVLYSTLFYGLLSCSKRSNDSLYLVFFALLGALFFYAQLFAVHKLLSFNAMLCLILALLCIKPTVYVENNEKKI